MKEQLRNDLLEYLGELMCEKEQTHDWGSALVIQSKIDSVNQLLGFSRKPEKSSLQEIVEYINKHPRPKDRF